MTALCYLYLSEVDGAESCSEEIFQTRLSNINNVSQTWGKWVKFERTKMTKGKAKACSELILTSEDIQSGVPAENMLKYSGLIQSNMIILLPESRYETLAQIRVNKTAGRSSIDNSLIRTHMGQLNEYHKNYPRAEKYYSLLSEQDTVLSVYGGIGLARCKQLRNMTDEADEVKNQLKQKYPLVDFEIHPSKSW